MLFEFKHQYILVVEQGQFLDIMPLFKFDIHGIL